MNKKDTTTITMVRKHLDRGMPLILGVFMNKEGILDIVVNPSVFGKEDVDKIEELVSRLIIEKEKN